MHYITFTDLITTIRTNIYKVPHDIDFIIGIERSGMIVASIISEYINVPLIGLKSFVSGNEATGGDRLSLINKNKTNKVLVIDDTCYSGKSMKNAKMLLKDYQYDFIYLVAYLEGKGIDEIDIYLEDVREYTKDTINIVLYEWNLHHHYPFISQRCIYDIDGVFCIDPPDELKTEEYEEYIKNAVPLFIPTVPIGKIVTYRLSKYMDITEKWLKEQGIRYNQLIMFKADSYKERYEAGVSPEYMKGTIYRDDKQSILFIESDDYQARMIHKISEKPVLCVSTNKLYQ